MLFEFDWLLIFFKEKKIIMIGNFLPRNLKLKKTGIPKPNLKITKTLTQKSENPIKSSE
jgi:hypothetical protein